MTLAALWIAGSILLILFRFVIAPVLHLHPSILRPLLATPFAIVAALYLRGLFAKTGTRPNRMHHLILLGSLVFSGTFFLIQSRVFGLDPKSLIIPAAGSTVLFLPFLAFLLPLPAEVLKRSLGYVSLMTLIVAPPLVFLEEIARGIYHLTTQQILTLVAIQDPAQNTAVTHYIESARFLGFLLILHHSATLLSAALLFFFADKILGPSLKLKITGLLITILGLFAIGITTALLNFILTIFFICLLLFYCQSLRGKRLEPFSGLRRGWMGLMDLDSKALRHLALIFSIPVLVTGFRGLYLHYLNYSLQHALQSPAKILDQWVPQLWGCQWSYFFMAPLDIREMPGCTVGELHLLSGFLQYGVLPALPLFFLYSISVIFIFVRRKNLQKEDLPVLFMHLALVIGSIHYPAIERWGINYVFYICSAYLLLRLAPRRLELLEGKTGP